MKNRLKITKELTAKRDMCGTAACPAIFESNRNSYVLIGKVIDAKKLGISKRVNKDEIVVEIPKNIIDNKSN